MLQQTQAGRVVPAFERFLAAFPTVGSLAAAARGDVVRAWNGLGYNRRAVALSEAGRRIVRDHGGRVPSDLRLLRALPGIGPYTSAAVASVAFGVAVPAIDTNVRRVVARLLLGIDSRDASATEVVDHAERWLDPDDPGAWNQALMDLGREVCRPRPRCDACPLAAGCRFLAAGTAPRSARPRPSRFEGSTRQVRGAVIRALRDRSPLTLGGLAARTGFEPWRVRVALEALDREGLVVAGTAALAGLGRGRVRLPG
jgi:A/G-specific adenine glycosylase